MFKVNNRDTRAISGIFSKVTINLPERRHWLRSSVFIVNFEQVNTGWVKSGCLKGVNVVYTFFTYNLKIETFNLLIDTCIHVMLYAYLYPETVAQNCSNFFLQNSQDRDGFSFQLLLAAVTFLLSTFLLLFYTNHRRFSSKYLDKCFRTSPSDCFRLMFPFLQYVSVLHKNCYIENHWPEWHGFRDLVPVRKLHARS